MELGVQLFGCSKEFRADTEGFFDSMKQIGYTQIEPCILFDREGPAAEHFTGILWSPEDVGVFKSAMDKRGLHLRSAHAFCSDIPAHSDEMLKLAEEQGITSFVFNIPEKAHDDLASYAAMLDALAEKLSPTGCEVWIHNVQRNFAPVNDSSVFETVLSLTKNVYSQIDTGWAMFDGKDPAELIALPETKLHGLHIKDMDKDFANKTGFDIFAVVGTGATVLPDVIKAAGDVYIVIDQDMSKGDFIEDLRNSYNAVAEAQ